MFKPAFSLVAAATLVASIGADTLDIDPVIVTAAKTDQPLPDVTSGVDLITSEELEEKHILSVADALNLLPGISIASNGGLGKSTSVFIRGFDTNRVLVLINGIRYNDNTSTGGASFEHLITSEIDRIEVIKGAQSGVWGSEASAGVINIITKKAPEGATLSAHTDFGSFSTRSYGARVGYATGHYDLLLSANKVKTDGFSAYARRYSDIGNYEDDGYRNTTLNIRGGYNFDESNRLSLVHTDIDVYTEYDNPSSDSDKYYAKKENLSGLSFENRSRFATTRLHANRSTFKRDYSTGSKFYGRIDEYEATAQIPYARNDFILLGGSHKSYRQTAPRNWDFSDKALFVTNSNHFADKFILTESFRSDRYDAFDDKTTGKIGIRYNIDTDLYAAANYGTGYNVPTLYQLYTPTYGNPGLRPESTRSYDLTFGYNGFTLTYFDNRVKEMIDYDFGMSQYNNISGTSRLKGIETAFKHNLTDDALISLGYTRLSAKNQNGEELRRRPKENLKFGIDYYGISRLHAGLYGEYVGERFDSDNRQGEQTGKYTVANLTLNYDLSKNVKIYGKIDNITDKYYQTVNNYATSPRAYYAGIEVSFK